MRIDVAIGNLEKFRDVDGWGLSPDILNSVNLGIEALKRVGAYRHFPDRGPGELLPGETNT